jgi:stage II sporulation protein D
LLQCEEPATLVREQGLKNYKYSGNFEIKAVPAGKNPRHLQVVNVNSFEAYLKGVVPSEVFSSWPLETLKAQAVAARTYAYAQILNERKKKAKLLESNAIDDKSLLFDVDDTVSYQAYSGILPDTKLTDQAVEETVGEVMLFNGKIIVAYFSADSGGFTESAENVWGKAVPYCQSKSEKYELSLVKSDWIIELSFESISESLKLEIGEKEKIVRIEIKNKFPSGRAQDLRLTLEGGKEVIILATKFQYRLKLKSTLFQLTEKIGTETDTPKIVFQGRGNGHGVGMSQWGAKVLADSMGWKYRQILEFYYTGITIESLPDQPEIKLGMKN